MFLSEVDCLQQMEQHPLEEIQGEDYEILLVYPSPESLLLLSSLLLSSLESRDTKVY